MAPRAYVMYPDERLRRRTEPVAAIDDAVRAIWNEMLEAMYTMPGVGLAAPQLGIVWRLAVVDCTEGARAPVRLANPELIWASDETRAHQEGSPNLPGLFDKVVRPARVGVRYLDETGAAAEREFDGLWATSVQHQIDHLDGRLFIDRLSPARRRRLLERHRKQVRALARDKSAVKSGRK